MRSSECQPRIGAFAQFLGCVRPVLHGGFLLRRSSWRDLIYGFLTWIGLSLSHGASAADDRPPQEIPGKPQGASQTLNPGPRANAEIQSFTQGHSFTWWCDCNGRYYNLFTRIDGVPAGATPISVVITSVEVRGDLLDYTEYVEFKVSGTSSWNRYQGFGDDATFDFYYYNGPQPTLKYSNGQYGFDVDIYTPPEVDYSPPGMIPAGAYHNLKINFTVTYSDGSSGPVQPPALDTLTPGDGSLTLGLTPPSSGASPKFFTGFCERSSGSVSANSTSAVAIPDNGQATARLQITEPNRSVVGNVTATVNISHGWIGDLEISLRSPSGLSRTLWTGETLDSGTSLSRSFTVSDFNGQAGSGNWDLIVVDRKSGDSGTINNWSISFNAEEQVVSSSTAYSTVVPVTGLENGQVYSCYATSTAYDNSVSGASNRRSATVGGTPGKPAISVDPEDEAAVVFVKSVATGGLEITQYEGVCESSQGTRSVTSTNRNIEVTPLINGLGYFCKARARNQQGWGPYSDEEKVRPDFQPTGLPMWLLYSATNTSPNDGGEDSGGSGDDSTGDDGGGGDSGGDSTTPLTCDDTDIVSCFVYDIGNAGSGYNSTHSTFIPANKILAFPISYYFESFSELIYFTTNEPSLTNIYPGYFFHWWFSSSPAGPLSDTGYCRGAALRPTVELAWQATDGGSSTASRCELLDIRTNSLSDPIYLNTAICDSSVDCLPSSNRNYLSRDYYIQVAPQN